ncbi:BglG family transcription antiterminator [Candidatus Clostridium radicumherbarum]|uniref:BglG family transcription antiterminator n=1 Tax=Candidatus Clostridium radicumherbarum TaxID=3381662 RepID=A0ABW8TN97_9CLOT
MNDLTARQKFILNSIIEKGPLNIKDLSEQIAVSNRTISREIAVINKFLLDKNITINEINASLSIKGSKDAIKKLQQLLVGIPMQWLLSQDQKMLLIIAELLVSEEPYKSAYFSYQLNVVEGTITLYMDKIEQWLNLRNLQLERKRGYGIEISGSEWVKRNIFLELLYEYKSIDELLAFVYGSKNDAAINSFFKIIFDEESIEETKEILELLKDEMISMDDMSYFNSFIYILLSLKKAKSGFAIELPDYLVQDILSSGEFAFIKKIKDYLLSINITVCEDELAYIAIHLMGNKYIYNMNRKFEELGVPLEELSTEVIFEVEKNLNINIECDEQLILGLTQHFNPALYRINMGIQVKNPLINEIKDYYGNLFNAVNYACKLVFSKYNITMPQDEIGFLTMHIGAAIERTNANNNKLSALIICANGIATARILSNKIKHSIPRIGSITISSLKDWNEKDNNYDIILTTTKLNEKLKFENMVNVTPFLQNGDIEKINNFIKNYSLNNRLSSNFNALSKIKKNSVSAEKYKLLDSILENIQLEVIEADSFNCLIDLISKDLFSKKLIEDSDEVFKLIMNREEMGSVVIPNSHVALLHTRSDSVIGPFVGVYRLRKHMLLKSVGFINENVDTFIVMLARKNEDSYSLEQIGKISIALIEDKKFTEVLRLGDLKDLRSSLITILNEEAD